MSEFNIDLFTKKIFAIYKIIENTIRYLLNNIFIYIIKIVLLNCYLFDFFNFNPKPSGKKNQTALISLSFVLLKKVYTKFAFAFYLQIKMNA